MLGATKPQTLVTEPGGVWVRPPLGPRPTTTYTMPGAAEQKAQGTLKLSTTCQLSQLLKETWVVWKSGGAGFGESQYEVLFNSLIEHKSQVKVTGIVVKRKRHSDQV